MREIRLQSLDPPVVDVRIQVGFVGLWIILGSFLYEFREVMPDVSGFVFSSSFGPDRDGRARRRMKTRIPDTLAKLYLEEDRFDAVPLLPILRGSAKGFWREDLSVREFDLLHERIIRGKYRNKARSKRKPYHAIRKNRELERIFQRPSGRVPRTFPIAHGNAFPENRRKNPKKRPSRARVAFL